MRVLQLPILPAPVGTRWHERSDRPRTADAKYSLVPVSRSCSGCTARSRLRSGFSAASACVRAPGSPRQQRVGSGGHIRAACRARSRGRRRGPAARATRRGREMSQRLAASGSERVQMCVSHQVHASPIRDDRRVPAVVESPDDPAGAGVERERTAGSDLRIA